MSREARDIIRRPILTEKTTALMMTIPSAIPRSLRCIVPLAGGGPSSFSIAVIWRSRSASSSSVRPMTLAAMIAEDACPSAQAFTSCAKPETRSPSILSQTLTLEPHSLECACASASASSSVPVIGMLPAKSRIRAL